MDIRRRAVGSLALATLAASAVGACGGSTNSGSDWQSPGSNVGTYGQSVSEARSAVAAYGTAMTDPSVTAATCASVHEQYDGRVRPLVSQMTQMSVGLDRDMTSRGGRMEADFSCVSGTMLDELDYHAKMACTLPSLAADQAEVQRHITAMTAYMAHLSEHCGQMMGALDGGAPSFSPMMQGCQRWDGKCSGMMHEECCGGMMQPACVQ